MTHLARKLPALALAAVLGACGDKQINAAPPLDRFFFPTGMALRHVDAAGATCDPAVTTGCRTQLLVASSNFDLSFNSVDGGTVAVIDADAAVAAARAAGAPSPLPLGTASVLVGTPARIGSFAGELAVLDDTTCPGWEQGGQRAPEALVSSRSENALYRVPLTAAGPTCQGCALALDQTLADPYGVTVACGAFPLGDLGVPAPKAFAFVTFLRSPSSFGYVTRVDLAGDPAAADTKLNFLFDVVPTHSSLFDPATTRLYISSRYNGLGTFAPLRYITLARPEEFRDVSLLPFLRGAEPQGIARSSDGTRLYLGLRIYDPDEAARIGVRPAGDLGGALVVLDATQLPSGTSATVSASPIDVAPIDRGATVVRNLPRTGKRDLVVVTATDDSSLAIYDDESGALAQVLTLCDPGALPTAASPSPPDPVAPPPCPAGRSRLGAQPFGLAVDVLGPNLARLYVGSFDRSWVNVIDIDPEHPQAPPLAWSRLGQERP